MNWMEWNILFLIKIHFKKDSMKQGFIIPVLSLLSNTSTQSSPINSKELNDSIEYYIDSKDY